ncbi:MAG: recombination protein O N-terminal domain-containing protein [Candidatus Parcubacteria bacterium]|nr:recombination protein O N-terminal domain-containing protein [Candidatus Parcubacteria bacterium]
MRHKYETRAIVLARSPVGEASSFVVLLTPELGLVRALAQSVRKPGKLAAALATYAESDVVLVRGREGWRLSGAVLGENWFKQLQNAAARRRAARVSGLLLRLVTGEAHTLGLFEAMRGFFHALSDLPEDIHEAAEILIAIRMLAVLGLDEGMIPGGASEFTLSLLVEVAEDRTNYLTRINRGIDASGL